MDEVSRRDTVLSEALLPKGRTLLIPTAPPRDSRGIPLVRFELILWRGEDSRHGISGWFAGGLFGGRAPSLGGCYEEREPEPPAPLTGCGSGRDEPDRGCPDRRHGPADASRLGPSVQRAWPRGSSGQLVQGSRAAPVA